MENERGLYDQAMCGEQGVKKIDDSLTDNGFARTLLAIEHTLRRGNHIPAISHDLVTGVVQSNVQLL